MVCHLFDQSQGLKDVITTYSKLQANDSHRIYLMKNADDNE
jgi:hypothetical protein